MAKRYPTDPLAAHNIRVSNNADLGDDWPTLEDPEANSGEVVKPFYFTPEQLAVAAASRRDAVGNFATLAQLQRDKAADTEVKVKRVTTSIVDSHYEPFGGAARPKALFTGNVDDMVQRIARAGRQAGDLTTSKSKFEWKELNVILGLGACVNDDREQRMLECEKRVTYLTFFFFLLSVSVNGLRTALAKRRGRHHRLFVITNNLQFQDEWWW